LVAVAGSHHELKISELSLKLLRRLDRLLRCPSGHGSPSFEDGELEASP